MVVVMMVVVVVVVATEFVMMVGMTGGRLGSRTGRERLERDRKGKCVAVEQNARGPPVWLWAWWALSGTGGWG